MWDYPLAVIIGGVLAFIGSFSADFLAFLPFSSHRSSVW